MSESDGNRAHPRPRQVTVAAVMAAVACVLLVFSLFDSMALVRSAEMRAKIVEFLGSSRGAGVGLDVAGVVALLRGVVLLSGALAAAGAVLAVFTLQRHRGARIGLTVAAGLLLVSATFVSGILPVVVAVAAMMMWSREARDWFDGRAPRPAPAQRQGDPPPAAMTAWHPDPGAGARPTAPPPATYPFGTGPGARPGQQAGAPADHPTWPGAGYPAMRRTHRPPGVTAAVWLTWVFSALVAMFFGLVVLVILVDRDQLLEALQRNAAFAEQDLSGRQIVGALWLISAVSIFWALSAIALAALVLRRVEIGRRVLIVSAVLAGLVCLVAVPVGWPHAAAAFTCVALLGRRTTRDWFAGDGPLSGPPPPAQGLPSSQPPGQGKPPVW